MEGMALEFQGPFRLLSTCWWQPDFMIQLDFPIFSKKGAFLPDNCWTCYIFYLPIMETEASVCLLWYMCSERQSK